MKSITKFFNLYLFLVIFELISSKKTKNKPKCCIGTETFGIGLFSTGMSCSDMINCCPSGTFCSSGKCILRNKNKKRKITRNWKNYEEKSNSKNNNKKNDNDDGPTFKVGDEIIKPTKIERKPTFSGPVKINWKTFSQCFIDSKSEEQVIKDIIKDYKRKKESSSVRFPMRNLKRAKALLCRCAFRLSRRRPRKSF